jgi:4-hydroxy-3-methylbut-2-en-1-yl diphosphate reductase
MELYLASPQGFCAGVSRAIEVVEKALRKYGKPLYVYHHIVHNNAVIENFEKKGVVFVEAISDIPFGNPVVFSAHGVSPEVIAEAKIRELKIIDATCPLVKKIHLKANKLSGEGSQIILIGHKGHQEIVGTAGYVDLSLIHYVQELADIDSLNIDWQKPVAYLTQTTLSVSDTAEIIDRIKHLASKLSVPLKKDICFATQNRQEAVVELTKVCDIIIICGSPHSSNSNRLKETAHRYGVLSYIIDSVKEFDLSWLEGKREIGLSSGASVPEYIVLDLIKEITKNYPAITIHHKKNTKENINFSLPNI